MTDGTTRVLSCIQPTGEIHLGNLLGALTSWVADQERNDCFYGVVDLHALTVQIDPMELRRKTAEAVAIMLSAGIDTQRSTVFVQSLIPAHCQLAWLMECTASVGELTRMTQFKDKSDRAFISAGLLTYPTLMAADILLYQAHRVPVGDDQRQHLELARTLAQRFNSRYGDTFVVPNPAIPSIGARVMNLQDPSIKMSKSKGPSLGTILLTDSDDEIVKKVRRATTDSKAHVVYAPEHQPGVSNLLTILAAATRSDPVRAATGISTYSQLKRSVADALVELVRPIRRGLEAYLSDEAELWRLIYDGSVRAARVANGTLAAARHNIGLPNLHS